MKAVHLRVERPCVARRVSACLRPKTKRGETSSVRWPRNTYWASRTSSERAGTREASRSWQCNHQGSSAGKQSIPWSWTRTRQSLGGQTWTKAYKVTRQEGWGDVLNTCRELGQTRDKGSRWGRSPWIPWWRPTRTEAQYLSCYANVPKKEGGIFDILMGRFTLKKRGLF